MWPFALQQKLFSSEGIYCVPVTCQGLCWLLRISQFSHWVMSDSLWPHGLQHARLPKACSNSCPLSWWCHPTILSFIVPFSSCLQSFSASGSFPMRQFFLSDGQSNEASASASVLPVNIQGWFPLGLTGLIFLKSKGLWVFFSTTQLCI